MIVIVSGVLGDTRRYRTFHLYQQMHLVGLPCVLSHTTDPLLMRKVSEARILILHRAPIDRHITRVIAQARANGATVLVDVDDLTFDPQSFRWINSPDFQDTIRRRIYQENMLRQRATIESADAVIASTQFLAEQVKLLSKPVWVHRNAFSPEMLLSSQNAKKKRVEHPERVVMGYASGTPTHNRDFELIRRPLQAMLEAYPQVELWLVGPLDPGSGFEKFGDRVRRLPLVPWRELPYTLAQFDINLAPLVTDNPFSQSKSEIKYMEAGLVQVPTIASPTDAFQYAITQGENGFLATSEHEWQEALEQLISQNELRMTIGKRSDERVMAEYHPVQRARDALEMLRKISDSLGGGLLSTLQLASESKGTTKSIDPAWEVRPNKYQRGLYSLRHRGVLVLLGEVWVYFRRLLVPIFPFDKSQDS